MRLAAPHGNPFGKSLSLSRRIENPEICWQPHQLSIRDQACLPNATNAALTTTRPTTRRGSQPETLIVIRTPASQAIPSSRSGIHPVEPLRRAPCVATKREALGTQWQRVSELPHLAENLGVVHFAGPRLMAAR